LLGDDTKILPSMSNFLLQEVDKFNNFLSVIRKTLEMLEKAIKGIISMNEDLDEMTVAFSMNTIPRVWRKYCYETLKSLSSCFADFKERI
jgi:dynein heavy chain